MTAWEGDLDRVLRTCLRGNGVMTSEDVAALSRIANGVRALKDDHATVLANLDALRFEVRAFGRALRAHGIDLHVEIGDGLDIRAAWQEGQYGQDDDAADN